MKPGQSHHKLTVEPYTQWEPGVASPASACGPATMAALMEYWSTRQGKHFIGGENHFYSKVEHINHMYSHHGGTPWGMSVRSFIRGIKDYIGASSETEARYQLSLTTFKDINRYIAEIDAERPVAIKFDKWFTFRWRGRYAYAYHWVLGIGYETFADGATPILIVLDNGIKYKDGGFAPSKERRMLFSPNKGIITMVALNIIEASEPKEE
ncbi:C39 family peptidase [Paenibacillus sp. 19GGS1-52]|uniref:C39 family peptidase n=1 Tax=Paenibacillus sp. 19GGS1-52 TaxID=2758563 RepID=UPI001EFC2187|nr:C39 family peptidase [Paenibacillus sp. 19GGS1-52]ULO07293.1 C39 family peptidase [Paenibacillus sp. 19GGS1-52]